MTSILVPLATYPLAAPDEQRAIDRLAIAVATVRHRLSKEFSHEWLNTKLRECLREGGLSICAKAVEAADRGDEMADAALRDIGAELQAHLVQRQGLEQPGHLQVIAYLQRAATRAPAKRRRGRYAWQDNWYRDLAICILIQLACAEYGVQPTRNRESRRGNRAPSGISLLTAALARNKLHIEEKTIQRHIWFGLPGELVRKVEMRLGSV